MTTRQHPLWPTARVSEIADVVDYVANGSFASLKANVSYKDEPDYAVLVRLTDFNNSWNGGFVYVPEHSFRFLRKSSLAPGDIIIANVGAYAGKAFRAPKLDRPMTLGPNAIAVKTKAGFDSPFYFYFFSSPLGQGLIHNIVGGAAQPKFNKTDFRALEVPFPPFRIQQRIAGILSAYDDLTENNQRRIKILEEMARALYREWFVEFRFPGHEEIRLVDSPLGRIPQGWEVKRLGEAIELNYGKALKQDERRKGAVPVYGSSGVVGYHDSCLVNGPGIIVGRKGNVGSVFWSDDDFFPIDTVYFVTSRLPLRFLFYDLQMKNFINNDSAVPGLNRNQAYSLQFTVPPIALLTRFVDLANAFENQASLLRRQSINLRRTRDLLLPRLLSGQIDLSAIEKEEQIAA